MSALLYLVPNVVSVQAYENASVAFISVSNLYETATC